MRQTGIRTRAIAGAAAVAATAAGLLAGPVVQPAAAAGSPELAASAAAAARAAYPTNHFNVPYGASYAQGTLTWYNRSVGVTGTRKVHSVCQRFYLYTYDSAVHELDVRSTSLLCPTAQAAITPFSVPADVPGGAAFVSACLADDQLHPLGDCVAYARSDAS
ncbi:hypothetical protein OHS18_36510 [Amycolatopsis sp. NBC_00355]|uniref:hypothetical protein n=1 Tax=Amycolatopsis sp. NBC_00355 TaxID=2975957 RepID=UPI002E26C3BF